MVGHSFQLCFSTRVNSDPFAIRALIPKPISMVINFAPYFEMTAQRASSFYIPHLILLCLTFELSTGSSAARGVCSNEWLDVRDGGQFQLHFIRAKNQKFRPPLNRPKRCHRPCVSTLALYAGTCNALHRIMQGSPLYSPAPCNKLFGCPL